MKMLEFNPKVKESILNTGYLNVWEGAVRSSKTLASLIAWGIYIGTSPEKVFLMSGATMGSISRNCIIGEYGFVALTGAIQRTDTDGSKYLQLGDKLIYYVGSDNTRSFQKIRGMTIGGWLADEINLHNPDFIAEAFNRSLASSDRKNFWTLNPSPPNHFIYTEYVDRYLKEGIPGYHYHHFLMSDNPAITPERMEEIKKQYQGVFYQRFILGRRVRAEGAIYTAFNRERNVISVLPEKILYSIVGADIGGNKSATSYIQVGFFWKDGKLNIVAMNELYDKENISTESILKNFKDFVGRSKLFANITDAYIDSAEQLIVKSMKNLGVVNAHGSKKIAIIDRIRLVDFLLASGRFVIMSNCVALIDALETAVWNPKGVKEERLDDGSSNVDSLDSLEYAIERSYKELMQ